MRWIALVLAACFFLGCCFFQGCDGDTPETPENGVNGDHPTNGTNGGPEPAGTPQVIETRYVRLLPHQDEEFSWTSTGPGLLTASLSWQGAAELTLYLDKGGKVAQQQGPSPLSVSAQVGGAGEAWTIGMYNASSTSATASYTLTFLPD